MCLVIILSRSSFAFGDNWSGNVSGQTISTNTEVTLTGDVTLKGTITINSGVTLTINGNNKTITTYTTTTDKTSTISFDVKGTLIMKDVTLEGGCVGSVGNYSDHDQSTFGKTNKGGETETNTTFTTKKNGNAINVYGIGQLQLTNVVAQNMYTNRDLGCFLQVGVTGKEGDIVETIVNLNNVTVKNCLTDSDQGIINASGTHAINKITMTNCTISYCMVKEEGTGHGYGGVLKGNGGTTCILDMTNCTMNNCWGSGWGGAILWAAGTPSENGEESKATLNKCQFYYNYARYLGGAISNEARMELTECTIEHNQAGFGGGGIAAFPFTLGTSEGYEGLKEAVGLTLVEKNKISNNQTLYITNKGGVNVTEDAIVKGKTSVALTEDDYGFNPYYTHRMITGNTCYPSGGGGLWVLMNMDGWTCNLSIGASNEITNNSSAYNGGGVFLYKKAPSGSQDYTSGGNTSMTLAALIQENTAGTSGGGVAVGADNTISTYPSITVTGGSILGNEATNGNGGGVYMPGGAFILNGGSITNNKAKVAEGSTASSLSGNGGGIAITNGTFTISSPTSEISENEADHYGGGLYVSNTKSTNIAFTGGTFTSNSAYAGGGACVDGPVTLTVTNSNFESNTAKVGGGICLTGGESGKIATMTYNSGRIRNNTADASNNDTGITGGTPTGFTTAYQKGISDRLEGIGGGVFLDSYSSLTFGGNTDTPIGLYGNLAYNGADDIFANGLGTSVHLPNVTGMQLADFKVPVDPKFLYWVKDYITDDTDYSNAPKMTDENAYTGNAGVKRYRYALSSMSADDLYWKLSPNTYTGYVSVALGYEVIYATINKYGLEQGKKENAIFTLTQKGQTTPYIRMVVSADNSKETTENGETYISKRVALPAGIWTIAETSWSWAYDLTLPDVIESSTLPEGVEKPIVGENYYTRELTQASTKANSKMPVFNFKNNEKTGTGTTELRMENIKVNKMKASTSGN